jgi:hypothetical protein
VIRFRTCLLLLPAIAASHAKPLVEGELKRWHRVTVTFEGPQTSEDATSNPFRNYRLNVEFKHGRTGRSYTVPGFYAADGRAGESSAKSGNKWRVHFTPGETGGWTFRAAFRSGEDIAILTGDSKPESFDGESGSFTIAASDKKGSDFRAKGALQYTGAHYLRFAGSGEYYLKGGADSPENFLAYEDFDDTYDADADSGSYRKVGPFIHKYAPHVSDWQTGDPSWKGEKGRGIIGALNYLAGKGVNSVYFMTYNVDGGDGRDTWMWTKVDVRDRFDTSKLDQWETVFSHMTRKGIMLHVVTQETENDRNLGGSAGLNPIRKLYYRELVARFAHHPAVIWNLGEENNTPDSDRKQIAAYIRSLDAYRHPITVHTHNRKALTFYDGILGDPSFEATSIQGEMQDYNREAIEMRRKSAAAGRKWSIFADEQAPDNKGVLPDEADPAHDIPRIHGLWGNLLGGGSGVEWYFGHAYPHMDINCEDFRSRDRMWDLTRFALEFFRKHLPFWEMEPDNSLVSGVEGARVFAKAEAIYAVQLPVAGEANLRLGNGSYSVAWFNPRTGGDLQKGIEVKGPGAKAIGKPPADGDWIALVKRR